MNHLTEKQQKKQDNWNAFAQLIVGVFMTTIGVIVFYVLVGDTRIDEVGFVALLLLCLILCVTGCIILFDAIDFFLKKPI